MLLDFIIGVPDRIRTDDLQSRSLLLYPAELQALVVEKTGDPFYYELAVSSLYHFTDEMYESFTN